jgi:large subunit ribosomal protein L13
MTTTHVRSVDMEERWLLYDASEQNLGRMAAKIATQLMGKDRPTYTPSEAGGTHVVVINGATPRLSGNKSGQKVYRHYTGYPNGQREVSLAKVAESRPTDIVTLAVRRMLPKNRKGRNLLSCLKVYPSTDHPHSAQKPVKADNN